MSDVTNGSNFFGFDYMDITVACAKASIYLDCYVNFGWRSEENIISKGSNGKITITLKRNRKILNKAELTRLQRNFEACMEEIETLEKRQTNRATILSLAVGIAGTGFMAGSVFAVTNEPPIIWLCILLAIPAFSGWALAPILYKSMIKRNTQAVKFYIEQKYDEIYEVCEKGSKLL